ncbi:MAG TPA: head-tail connector protein [Trueperaceae bacterium]
MAWPPTLDQLKRDMKIEDDRDDERLQQCLDAAVAYVERVRKGDFNFTTDPESELPEPTADLILGTLRLAGRWHIRRRSPDALVDMGELGLSRIATTDPDIERLLRIGRFQKARVG